MSTTNEEDEIRKIIERSSPVNIMTIGHSKCVKESELLARAGSEDKYVAIRSNVVTCIDMILMFIASRKDEPPSITDLLTYARSIGITSTQQLYTYIKKLCLAGLVTFKYKCGLKYRCDVVPGCPITAVEPTDLGMIYASSTALLTDTPETQKLRELAAQYGITKNTAPLIRLAIIKSPKQATITMRLINTKK
jgi:hypothetical protein